MLTRIVTFYMQNMPRSILNAQGAVFAKFGQNIEQILTSLDHGPAIDQYIRNSQFDNLLIFDVDCIPLNQNVVPEAIQIVSDRLCIYGVRQKGFAGGDYVGPAFICFSRKTFDALGRPSFRSVKRKSDTAAQLTFRALQSRPQHSGPPVEIRFLNVAEVAVPRWSLDDGTRYGPGTNYENKVFHAFTASTDNLGRRLFLEKAAEIVGHSDWFQSSPNRVDLPSAAINSPLPVFVISLRDAEDRRRKMTSRLNAAGLPFQFVDAIDGRARLVPDQIDRALVVREAFDGERAFARAASHRLVHRIVADGDNESALVLEDDAVLPDNFRDVIAAATELDFDILKLEGGDHDAWRAWVGWAAGYAVIVRRIPSLGSAAYLIRRSAAARFCNLPMIDQTVGAAFNDLRLSLRVFELEPFPVIQDGEVPHYTWRAGPRPSKWAKFVRAVRMRYRLLRIYGFRILIAVELWRFRASTDRVG